jgi:HK97 family phage portal protein
VAWYWPFGKREEERQQYTLEQLLGEWSIPTYAGMSVTADTAMRLSAVWSCVDLLASTISTMPVDVFRRGDREPLDPLPPILQRPSALLPEFDEWLYAVLASLLLRGNAFGLVTARSGATLLPTQVDLANPDMVSVRQLPSGRVEYRIGGQEQDPADIWHVRAFTMPGQVEGLSPITYAKQAIGLGLAAEKYAATWFADGAVPSGVIEAPEGTTFNQGQEIHRMWEQRKGSARPAIIAGGKYVPISVAPEESQFLETTKATVATIARFYAVPPEMVGSEVGASLTYSNLESRSLHFLLYSINRWLVKLDKALSRLVPSGQYVKLKPDGILRSATQQRYSAYAVALKAGFLSVDEVRELENLPPLNSAPSNGSRTEPWIFSER